MKLFLIGLALALSSLTAYADTFAPVRDDQVPSGIAYDVRQPAVEDPQLFAGKKVAILASHGVEESEIVFPYEYLVKRGADVEIIVPEWTREGVVAAQFLKPTLFVRGTRTFKEAQTESYDLVVLTGGAWNAQVVRSDAEAIKLVKAHYQSNLPLAAICAGTTVLIDAKIAQGTRLTGSPVVRPDLINAGALYVDQAAVRDGNLLTSRSPNDLVQFVNGLKDLLIK